MLVVALALLVQQGAPPSAPDDDIVVVGRRLQGIRVVTRTDRRTGERRCRAKRGSGDPALDAMVCTVAIECSRGATAVAPVEACVTPRLAAIPRLYIGGNRQVSVGRAAR